MTSTHGFESATMMMRTTVRLPAELLASAKRKAQTEGRTLASLIEEGLRRALADEPVPARPERIMPPVSKARGGFAPGITSLRDVQELEDREYAERMGFGVHQVLIVGELDEETVAEIAAAQYGEPT